MMDIRVIQHNSPEYERMILLRVSQLLEPIGVPASYIERENEKDDFFIGAFEKDEFIGCCILSPRTKAVIQLRQMTVRSDHRGKGIGATIIDFAERFAKENQFSTLMMHARDPVIDFYKKCGYEVYDEPFFEVGIGHRKMKKQLK